jgi:hypothetical protein
MTAQWPDSIDYEGARMSVGCDIPLCEHPRIRYVDGGEKNHFLTDSTACWKGCIGSWRITNGQLYLTGIEGAFEFIGDEPLPATWVTEKMRLVAGNAVKYVHMGYLSTFEHEIVLKIKKGRLVRVAEEPVSRFHLESG